MNKSVAATLREIDARIEELRVVAKSLRKVFAGEALESDLREVQVQSKNLLDTADIKDLTLGQAVMQVVPDGGKPFRCTDIMKALEIAGFGDAKKQSVLAGLSKQYQAGYLERIYKGLYRLKGAAE